MAKFITLLMLLPLINAQIQINIVASDKKSDRKVSISGSNVDIISSKEIDTFKLNDNNLKNAVNKYFGSRPTDAYLKSPTPWGDLYNTYGWPQVTRILTPQRARILGVSTQPTIVLTQVFNNTSSKKAKFSAKIQQAVENTVSSTWEKGGELTVGQEIEYGFNIEAVAVSGKTSISYTNSWGQSASKSEAVTVGSESGVEIDLEPNQSVIAELYATRGSMKIQIDYEATLSGNTAVNYKNTYKGHHFWTFGINSVMSEAGMTSSVMSTETIKLGYYSDSRVVIRDAKSYSTLVDVPLTLF